MSEPSPRQTFPFHPFLLAVFPALAVYAQNMGDVLWQHLAAALLLPLIAAGVVFLIMSWFYSTRGRAGLATSLVMAAMLGFGLLYQLNGLVSELGTGAKIPQFVLYLIAGGLVAAGLDRLRPLRKDEARLTLAANVFALLAVASPLVTIGMHASTAAPAPTAAQYEGQPAPEHITLSMPDSPPDIYYLVFDRYADEETLRTEFGFDNGPFLDELRKRGFHIAGQSRANYPKTDLSMASVFNMQLHGEQLGPKSHYIQMLGRHRVARLLTDAGYDYYHMGALLDGLRTCDVAKENYWLSAMPSEYTDIVFQYTMFQPLAPNKTSRQQVLEKFNRLEELAATPGAPKLVYAHFITPHYPWKFNADGSQPTRQEINERPLSESYAQQLAYTNQRILQTIDAIQARSKTPPIIVLQADEGPELMYQGDAEKPLAAQIRKRNGILSAFCLPGVDAAEVTPETITPVNTFRLIFRETFAADLPLAPDKCFYWKKENPLGRPHFGEPCQLVEVTDLVTAEAVAGN